VQALVERGMMELRFPNVEGYVMELRQHKVRCDVSKVEPLTIRPTEHPTQVYVQPQVGIKDAGTRFGRPFALVQTRPRGVLRPAPPPDDPL
jgi:hypothetical protein